MATQEELTTLVDRVWTEAFEGGKLDVIDEAISDDYVLESPGSGEKIRGPEAFKEYVRSLRNAFPDVSVTIEDRIVTDDAIVERYTIRGTHEGEFMGVSPTGTEVTIPGLIVHYVEEGKVTKDVSEWDALDVMDQLGVIEPPSN